MTSNAVPAEENVYRRSYCNPLKRYCNPDGSATSRAFKLRPKDEGRLSVDLESLTTPERSVVDPESYILFSVGVADIRFIDLDCIHEPVEGNNAHASILGMDIEDEEKPALLARRAIRIVL